MQAGQCLKSCCAAQAEVTAGVQVTEFLEGGDLRQALNEEDTQYSWYRR